MKFSKLLLLFLIVPLISFSVHKYYISLCEIEYVENQKTIQITIGLFIDDIETTLNKNNNANLKIATQNEVKNIDTYFETYLNKHLNITINNTPKKYTYIGKEYDNDIVRFYLEISNIEQLKSITVKNTALFKYFEEQQNIIKIYAYKKHKTFYLDKKNDNCLLKF